MPRVQWHVAESLSVYTSILVRHLKTVDYTSDSFDVPRVSLAAARHFTTTTILVRHMLRLRPQPAGHKGMIEREPIAGPLASLWRVNLGLDTSQFLVRSGSRLLQRSYALYPRQHPPANFVPKPCINTQVLMDSKAATSTEEALAVGNAMMSAGIFNHVTKDHPFKDEALFYRFKTDEDEEFHGGCAPTNSDHCCCSQFKGSLIESPFSCPVAVPPCTGLRLMRMGRRPAGQPGQTSSSLEWSRGRADRICRPSCRCTKEQRRWCPGQRTSTSRRLMNTTSSCWTTCTRPSGLTLSRSRSAHQFLSEAAHGAKRHGREAEAAVEERQGGGGGGVLDRFEDLWPRPASLILPCLPAGHALQVQHGLHRGRSRRVGLLIHCRWPGRKGCHHRGAERFRIPLGREHFTEVN